MNMLSVQQEFPIHALPVAACNSALELHNNTGAPLGLIAASTLTAMSLVMQGLINVRRLDGLEGPVSAWYLIVAESGERKTGTDEKNLKTIREFDVEQAKQFKSKMLAFETAMQAWEVERKAILSAIKKSTTKEEPTDDLKKRLNIHAATMPKKPRLIRLLYNDASPAGLKSCLGENSNSIGLVSDEGASIFCGQAITDLSLHNSLWGGATIQVDRAKKSLTIVDPRLTISVMVQPGTLQRYLDRKGEEASEQGFFARFNFCSPLSTQGTRFIYNSVTSWQHLPIFQARIREIADANVGQDGEPVEKITLSFTPQAQERWISAYNDIESRVSPGREFFNVKDYAAKLADNMARLAALFHFFDGNEGQISLDTLERAITVQVWFANEYLRLFSPPPQMPQEQRDAFDLEIWFAQYLRRIGVLVNIKRNYILQRVPIAMRKHDRFDVAVNVLFGAGKIGGIMEGKTRWITLNPSYFTPQQVDYLCAQGAMKT